MTDTPFQRLYHSGFRTVLPLIPHGADISPHSPSLSKRRPEEIGKIPGARTQDGWVGLAGWQNIEADEHDLRRWGAWGADVGLRCRDVVGVDVDVTHPDLADLVELEVLTHLGFAPVRVGRAPKRLYLFRLTEPGSLPTKMTLPFRDWEGTGHVIELLGAKQQFVVDGIHPVTGKPYTWDQHPSEGGLDGLTEVSVAELERFLAAVADAIAVYDCEPGPVRRGGDGGDRDAETLRTADLTLLRAAVDAIPNEGEEAGREAMVAMAHAVWGAASGSEEGLEIFLSWAERYDGQDMEHAEQVYRTVRGSRTGIQWLLDRAHEHGFDTAPEDFDYPRDDYRVPDHGATDWDGEVPGEANQASTGVFTQWVYVNGLKRFVHVGDGRMLDKEQFSDAHRHLQDEKRSAANRFLDHCPEQAFVDEVDYVPGTHERIWRCGTRNRRILNTWSPGPAHGVWAGEAGETDAGPWLELVRHLFPDAERREPLLDWLAALLQRPHVKPNYHPLICSERKGIGKDTLLVPLMRGLAHNATTIDSEMLEQPWTHWVDGKQLVVVSELQRVSRKSSMSRLISLMATPPDTVSINKKNMPQYEVSNRFGMVMFSNSDDAAAIEKHDRRFFVLRSNALPLPETFYRDLHAWLDQGGCQAVVRWLLARDIAHFNSKGQAPMTEEKEAMRRAALPQVEGLLLEAIEDEEGPFRADLVTMAQVRDWLKPHANRLPSPNRLAVMLHDAGAVALGRVRVDEEEGRQRMWAVRRGATWKQLADTKGLPAVRDKMIEMRAADPVSGADADFGG